MGAAVSQPAKRKEKDLLAEEFEYVDDFGSLVRSARERMGLSQEEFAKLIKEKVTAIRKIEQGELHPPLELARRLERVLKIRIVETSPEEPSQGASKSLAAGGITLGDIMRRHEDESG